MSQRSIHSQRKSSQPSVTEMTNDCPICMTTKSRRLVQLPCNHNLCLSCLHMICTHSTLACPFCRRRLSTWLRHNPNYSKLIVRRESRAAREKKPAVKKAKRPVHTSKPKPIVNDIQADWLLAKKIHNEQMAEFRFSHGRITRSMAKLIAAKS